MDQKIIFAKTPIGDEAVRQSTRVVQRNLRMVLVQVDGKLTVGELSVKLGDPQLVERALRDLEEGGYIAPTLEAVSVWQESKLRLERLKAATATGASLGTKFPPPDDSRLDSIAVSNFSTFGKPVLPAGVQLADPEQAPDQTDAGRRSPLAIVASGLVVVLLIAVLVLLFFPYDRFKPGLENELRRVWQTPVHIGSVQIKLLPQPGLLLADVRIGEHGDSTVDQIRLFSLFSLLGSGPYALERVEISGARVSADHLVALSILSMEQRGSPTRYVVRQAVIDRMTVIAGPLTLSDLNGEVKFLGNGQMEKAALQTVDRSLRMEIQPGKQGPLLTAEALGWRPTDISPLTFDSLQATGLLQKGKLTIQSFDSRTLGGVLKGSWILDWSKGLTMAGEATMERLDCRKISAIFAPSLSLEGDLMGSLRLRGAGSSWPVLWAGAESSLDAVIVRGVLHGVDLGEAARRGHGALVRAGSTKFDRLAVRVTIDPRQVVGRDLAMNAGMFTAAGQFVATREGQVDSNLQVTMQTSVSTLTLPIRISGSLPNLQATGNR
jgi:hypothetical protein